MAQREDLVAAELPHQLLDLPGSQARLLPGSRSHAQAGSLAALWPALLEALRDLESTGQDVLVDAGRLGLEGSPTPLLYGADLTVAVDAQHLAGGDRGHLVGRDPAGADRGHPHPGGGAGGG